MSEEKKHGCKSCFKSVVILIVGMLLGIVLFVGAIAGTIYVVLTSVTIEQVQNTIGVELVKKDNKEMLSMTAFDFVTALVGMIGNISSLSINDVLAKFNLPIPNEVSGIDITPLFKYPILEIPQHLEDVTKNIKLSAVSRLAGINFNEFGLPILNRLQDETIQNALTKILSSINGTLTIRNLSYDFGIDVAADNELLNNLKDLPISDLGSVIDLLTLSEIIKIDNDKFVKAAELDTKYLYVYADSYVAIDDLDTQNPLCSQSIFGVTSDGSALKYNELRYVRKTDENGNEIKDVDGKFVYEINNSSYYFDRYLADDNGGFVKLSSGEYVPYDETQHSGKQRYKQVENFEKYKLSGGKYILDATAQGKTFYRHIEYVPYDALGEFASVPTRYLKAYINNFVNSGSGYLPQQAGFVKVYDYEYLIGTSTTSAAPTKAEEFTPVNNLSEIATATKPLYFKTVLEDGTLKFMPFKSYGIDYGTAANPITVDENSSLTDEKEGYFKAYEGTSDKTLQSISTTKVKNLADVIEKVKNLKLCEVLDVYENTVYDTDGVTVLHEKSPLVLIALKNTKISDFSDKINTLTLKDIIEIDDADPNTSKILKSLKDSTLNSMSTDIGKLVLGDAIDIPNGSSAILKKLAYTKLNSIGGAINDIIDNLVIGEVIDVIKYNQLTVLDTATDVLLEITKPFIEHTDGEYVLIGGKYVLYDSTNPNHASLTRYSRNYIFVNASDGGYVFVPDTYTGYTPYDSNNLNMPEFTKAYFDNSENPIKFYALDTSTSPATFVEITADNYEKYKADKVGKYLKNYVGFAKKPKGSTAGTKLFKKVYVTEQLVSSAEEANTYVIADKMLTKFDDTNSSHASYTQYVPTLYDGTAASYIYYKSSNDAPFVEYDKDKHGKIENLSGKLYTMVKYDSAIHSPDSEKYIYYSGLLLDATGSQYSSLQLQHYKLVYGYIANAEEANGIVSYGNYANVNSAKPVKFLEKKSENILIKIADSSLSEINGLFKSLTLGSVIDSQPDSFFEGEIMNSKISEMATAITKKLSTASMGDVLTWANISVDPQIATAINNVTLQDFFNGLKITFTAEGKPCIAFELS
ncbi:MAG: hypothetical protein SPD42_00805 [Eubacteriales bacterium]|nr:hypothetical protein [Eubacteriales bacterium]